MFDTSKKFDNYWTWTAYIYVICTEYTHSGLKLHVFENLYDVILSFYSCVTNLILAIYIYKIYIYKIRFKLKVQDTWPETEIYLGHKSKYVLLDLNNFGHFPKSAVMFQYACVKLKSPKVLYQHHCSEVITEKTTQSNEKKKKKVLPRGSS